MPEYGKKSARHPVLRVLLGVLFLAFCLSSGMLGFVLGREAARPTGELMDTIVLSPESSQAASTLHFLSGRVALAAGEPCAGATVRLDDHLSAVTDENGKYVLSGVEAGSHILRVEDARGELLGTAEITLDFSRSEAPSAAGEDGAPAFYMPENTRLLELDLTVEEGGSLGVSQDNAYIVTTDGQMADFAGSALKVGETSLAVTPGGALMDSAGTVALPGQGLSISPQGVRQEMISGREVLSGVVPEEDGSVTIDEQITVTPEGEVVLPDGETIGGEDKVVLVEDGEAEELEELPDEYTPPQPEVTATPEPELTPEPEATIEPEPTVRPTSRPNRAPAVAAPTPAPTVTPVMQTPTAIPEPTAAPKVPPEATPTPEPTPTPIPEEERLQISDPGTGASWTQVAFVDLFKKRYPNKTAEGLEPVEDNALAAPGSSGYYEFKLKNPQDFKIGFTISLKEESFHLPIIYTVLDEDTSYPYLMGEPASKSEVTTSERVVIAPGQERIFRIDWEWPYEHWFQYWEEDEMDTQAGKSGSTYVLTVTLNAVQLDGAVTDDGDGDIRYPGKH